MTLPGWLRKAIVPLMILLLPFTYLFMAAMVIGQRHGIPYCRSWALGLSAKSH